MREKFLKWLVIIVGTLSWSVTMVKSAWLYNYGQGFWGANGHDGIWHLALANSLAKGNFENPVFSGISFQNYHLGFDLLLAFLYKLTGIRIDTLYFQVLPPIFALMIGLLSYKFVYLWTKSTRSSLLSTFFVYFGGSFAWMVGKGESAFWSTQAISTLINPPYALSLILILVGLIQLVKRDGRFRIYDLGFMSLIFGSLFLVKIYAGLLVLGSLFLVVVYEFLLNHKSKFLNLFLITIFISVVIYFLFNKSSYGLVVWQPFWFLDNLFGSNQVNWERFNSALNTYKYGEIWFKAIPAYALAFIIFIVGNFGTRILFIFRKVKLDHIHILIYSIIGAGVVIPMFFVQKGTPWNTIQFFYYSLFFSGLLAGVVVSELFLNRKSLIIILLLATLPTSVITLRDVYIPSRPPAMLPNYEIEALNFLGLQPDGIVLTYPFDKYKADEAINNPPRPLYLYESTAYVSAFSNKQVFLEDEVNLNITGYKYGKRKVEIENFFKNPNPEFLNRNNIRYIYLVGYQKNWEMDGLEKIFENDEVIIYKYE